MDRILIAASSDKHVSALINQLKEIFPGVKFSTVSTGREARRSVSEQDFDMLVVNCPLSDEHGADLAEFVYSSSDSMCVLLVKNDISDDIADKVEDYGAMVISKPLNRDLFYRAMRFTAAARKRMLGVRSENIKLQKKLEEIRTVNRAKLALMKYLGFTEQQAHRYIEKQAMDLRCTKLEVARKVIKMYEV
ncbi:ANTAR domain-containing protein [Ruminococcus sp.]|uniref:ANTAR domain-containing response regulator n=1 Tax=Ruminococcus sp. TaxID=41978 RepID=UPI0025DDE3CE|nr:ANTAR domain-containing protein [Ruminococcus sp.]MBQ8966994.1 ANTAR domain-containing protein [Ruminococcus sp.]